MHPNPQAIDIDEPAEIADDPRWDLLRDLATAAGTPWSGPISVAATSPRLAIPGAWRTPPPIAYPVTVTFDARVSLKALVATLRVLWPELAARGTVRRGRNRALGARKIELLRFLCLNADARTRTWEQRLAAWNDLVARNVRERRQPWKRRWMFGAHNVRGFRTACHDAEAQLTGSRHGLIWFYDADARKGGIGNRPDVEDRFRAIGIPFVIEKGVRGNG